MSTTATALIWGYVLIGVACAVLVAALLKRVTDPEHPLHRQDGVPAATKGLEDEVALLPGGMVTGLILVALFWPVALMLFLGRPKA
jgi:hypothetical protein